MRLMSRAAIALAVSLVAVPAVASAQASFMGAIGATLPMGDASDAWDMGYHATLGLGIKPPVSPVGFRFEGMFNQLNWKNATQGNTRILAGIANATLSGAAIPMGYFIGGVGMYNFKAGDLPSGFTAESVTKFGFNVGGGVNIPLSGFGTYVEARLHYIATEGSSTILVPLTFGVKF